MSREPKGAADVSVVIATYNRAAGLQRTLTALCRLDTTGLSWELLVVDNNSRDDTRAVCESFQGRLPIRCMFEPRQGQNHARNAALAVASGELIVMTDDDVEPCRTWLGELWRASRDFPDVDVFCGPVTTVVPEAFAGTLEGSVPTCSFRHSGGRGLLPESTMPISANLAFRRRILAGTCGGLFDPRIGPRGAGRISGSETVALKALREAGHRIFYVPEAHVLHETPKGFSSVGGLCRRAFAQGRGDVRVLHFGRDLPRLLGVPRFLLRTLAEDVAGVVLAGLCWRRKQVLRKTFHAARTAASILEWRRVGRLPSGWSPRAAGRAEITKNTKATKITKRRR